MACEAGGILELGGETRKVRGRRHRQLQNPLPACKNLVISYWEFHF